MGRGAAQAARGVVKRKEIKKKWGSRGRKEERRKNTKKGERKNNRKRRQKKEGKISPLLDEGRQEGEGPSCPFLLAFSSSCIQSQGRKKKVPWS